jgi:hypothetical protein
VRKLVLTVAGSLLLAAYAVAASAAITVVVNGQTLPADPPAVERGGSVLLPLRAVFEALQADVTWDTPTRTATATRRGVEVKMTLDNPTAYVSGRPVTLAVPPQLINDHTYVPVRFPAEAYGAQVNWEGATQTVIITLAEAGGPAGGTATPRGAPEVLAPRDQDKVGTRTEISIKTTPGVEQVIYTIVKNNDTGEVLRNVPGIRHLPNADGTYRGAIATPRVFLGETKVPVRYEIHFRNGPNDGDPETVITCFPQD